MFCQLGLHLCDVFSLSAHDKIQRQTLEIFGDVLEVLVRLVVFWRCFCVTRGHYLHISCDRLYSQQSRSERRDHAVIPGAVPAVLAPSRGRCVPVFRQANIGQIGGGLRML